MSKCRLYLITPSVIPDLAAFTRAVEEALGAGDVAALQIRMKDAPESEIEAVVRALTPICHAHDVAVILNDNPQLAKTLGCDGVHVGAEDTPLSDARKIMGPNAMIGTRSRVWSVPGVVGSLP